jgi:NAD(P)-dependent dehydrogenase (short-subunit alcohol dehydrogenase family)
VDISDPESIRRMYERVGTLDVVISCAGESAFTRLTKLTDEELDFTIRSKLVGQVNLVRYGVDNVVDGGSFVLTTGLFSLRPVPGVPAVAMANGGIESFARGAALDLPRGIRIAAISPPFITETAEEMGMSLSGTIPAAENAQSYLAFVAGELEGPVIFPGAS